MFPVFYRKWLYQTLVLLLGVQFLGAQSPKSSAATRRAFVPLQQVRIDDPFWSPKLEIYRQRTIPHSWKYMEWELKALRHAAGNKQQGQLNGTWGEANLYKFLETIALSLAQFPDRALEERVDGIVDLIEKAQDKDGFSHVFYLNSGKPKWDPDFLDGSHTGYVLGHMIEAALEYKAATGKTKFLSIAERAVAQAYTHFLGKNGRPGFDGHAELEMALVELYRVTRNAKALELSRAFVEWRGRKKVKPYSGTPRAYFQDEVPLRQQRTLEGHAVRALFFATGVADLALETGGTDYRLAADRFWQSTTGRRMTITGSVGPRKEHEAIGEDYELPNDGYYESCAACALVDFASRMFLLEGSSSAIEVVERSLYNAVLHGISLDGTNSYYQNPLSDKNNLRYNSWVCCPPNLSRTLFQVGRYAYAAKPKENSIYINLFVGGDFKAVLESGEVQVKIRRPSAFSDEFALQVQSPGPCTIKVRLPSWARTYQVSIDGTSLEANQPDDDGYLVLKRKSSKGETVRVKFDAPPEWIEAHPNVQACHGKVALQKGPFVYAFEGLDNPGLPRVRAKTNFEFQEVPELLGGIGTLRGVDAENKRFTAIPFFALANRGKTWQEVWVPLTDFQPSDRWWEGKLYRPYERTPPAEQKKISPTVEDAK
jgi:hypothetical protein